MTNNVIAPAVFGRLFGEAELVGLLTIHCNVYRSLTDFKLPNSAIYLKYLYFILRTRYII